MTNSQDVDRLAGELNAWSDDTPGGPSRLEGWLRVMIARGASDLLLVAGLPASIRVDGTITALSEGPLDGADIETAVIGALPAVAARRYQQGHPADASLALADLGRFRINLHRERGRAAAAVRALAAVYTQTLLPHIGGGRVPAGELLMVGYGARQHIRKNQVQHLHQEIAITRRHGSFTFEESLARLVQLGHLERREALARTGHPEELDLLLRSTPVTPSGRTEAAS